MSDVKEVNYGELDCKLSDYMATDGVVLKSALNLSDIVDDILKLVNECSYPNYRSEQLQSQLAMAEKVVRDLMEDIETPSRLGLGKEPNPDWVALNNALEYFKDKENKSSQNKDKSVLSQNEETGE